METKSSKNKMETVWVKHGFRGLFVVDPIGRSGGLALIWCEENELTIQNFSKRHINAEVCQQNSNSKWISTGFYRHPEALKRHESWTLLKHLREYAPGQWLCVGDFNEIATQSKKCGASLRQGSQMEKFQKAIDECQLTDLGYIGSRFTWNNVREDVGFTKERRDRGLANLEWCTMFGEQEVRVLAARTSDHKLLLLLSRNSKRVSGLKQAGLWTRITKS
jgi:hypothetical protein